MFKDQKGTTLFGEVGTTIAGALNTVLHGLDSFGETFDWKQFGDSIADGINKFFSTFDWKLAADTFNTLAHGILDAADAAVSGTDWLKTCCGITTSNGYSSNGTNTFGVDYYYEYNRANMFPLCSCYWFHNTDAGVW